MYYLQKKTVFQEVNLKQKQHAELINNQKQH